MTGHVYTADGRRLYTLPQLAEVTGISYDVLRTRRKRGHLAEPDVQLDGRTPLWTKETAMQSHDTDERGVCRTHGHVCTYVRSPMIPPFAAVYSSVDYKGSRYEVADIRDGDAGIELQLRVAPGESAWVPLESVADPMRYADEADAELERRMGW